MRRRRFQDGAGQQVGMGRGPGRITLVHRCFGFGGMTRARVPAWAVVVWICLFAGVVGVPATADAHVGHPLSGETTLVADPMPADPMSADPMSADPMSADPMSANPLPADPMSPDAAATGETSPPTCAGDCCAVGAQCCPAVALAAMPGLAPHAPARATGGVETPLANLASRERVRRPPKALL